MKYLLNFDPFDAEFDGQDIVLRSKDCDIRFKSVKDEITDFSEWFSEPTIDQVNYVVGKYYGKDSKGVMTITYWLDGCEAELCGECTGSGMSCGEACHVCWGKGKLIKIETI